MGDTDTAGTEIVSDSRTGLLHRDAFSRDLQSLVDKAEVEATALVLLEIEVEGIDFILRTFGPLERDRLVAELGRRIQDTCGGESSAYYITQGRFAVVLANRSYRQATRHAKALVTALHHPTEIAGVAYHVRAYVGVSHYPNHASSASELVRSAVFAGHQARTNGSAYATFDGQLDEQERHRFRLMVDLEQALESNSEIRLAYQPQVDLETGTCVGVEGLCRWDHPEFGRIPPNDFLPFVEHTALMLPLTEATLDEALQDLAIWRARGFEGTVAVNLSPVLFRDPEFLERILEHSRFFNVGLDKLHFEVTETGIMDSPNRAANMLGEIRRHGSAIAVDDFGTGHSSLAYLADLPIDVIKIDKFFVQNLSTPWGEAIVGAAATLANKLALKTVAEGIETQEHYEKCRALGVSVGQGFYIARPMFKEQFQEWIGM